jgi:hypothetical protein
MWMAESRDGCNRYRLPFPRGRSHQDEVEIEERIRPVRCSGRPYALGSDGPSMKSAETKACIDDHQPVMDRLAGGNLGGLIPASLDVDP